MIAEGDSVVCAHWSSVERKNLHYFKKVSGLCHCKDSYLQTEGKRGLESVYQKDFRQHNPLTAGSGRKFQLVKRTSGDDGGCSALGLIYRVSYNNRSRGGSKDVLPRASSADVKRSIDSSQEKTMINIDGLIEAAKQSRKKTVGREPNGNIIITRQMLDDSTSYKASFSPRIIQGDGSLARDSKLVMQVNKIPRMKSPGFFKPIVSETRSQAEKTIRLMKELNHKQQQQQPPVVIAAAAPRLEQSPKPRLLMMTTSSYANSHTGSSSSQKIASTERAMNEAIININRHGLLRVDKQQQHQSPSEVDRIQFQTTAQRSYTQPPPPPQQESSSSPSRCEYTSRQIAVIPMKYYNYVLTGDYRDGGGAYEQYDVKKHKKEVAALEHMQVVDAQKKKRSNGAARKK